MDSLLAMLLSLVPCTYMCTYYVGTCVKFAQVINEQTKYKCTTMQIHVRTCVTIKNTLDTHGNQKEQHNICSYK